MVEPRSLKILQALLKSGQEGQAEAIFPPEIVFTKIKNKDFFKEVFQKLKPGIKAIIS